MQKTLVNLFENKIFLILIISVIFAFTGALSAILDFSFIFAAIAAFGALSLILFFRDPLMLLFVLIITRMSLDYSSSLIYLEISKNIFLSLSQFMGIAVAILGLFLILFKRHELKNFPLVWPFLIVFFWGSATFFYSISPKDSFQELIRIFDLLVLSALAFASVKNIFHFKKLLLAIFISSIIPVAAGIYQLIFHIGFQDELVSIPRIYGTFSHPNVLSLYIFSVIVLAVLYYFTFAKSKESRFLVSIFIFGNIAMLYFTYTRIAWVALIVFLGILFFTRFKKMLIPLIFIPLVLFVFSEGFRDRIDETLNPPIDSSITWRKILWKDTAKKTIGDGRTLLGYGMNTFPVVSENLRGIQFGSNDPHNDFVKFFVEGGLIGLAIFIIYLGTVIAIIWRRKQLFPKDSKTAFIYEIILILNLALIVSSLTDNIFKNTPVQWISWTILGASLALAKQKKK